MKTEKGKWKATLRLGHCAGRNAGFMKPIEDQINGSLTSGGYSFETSQVEPWSVFFSHLENECFNNQASVQKVCVTLVICY